MEIATTQRLVLRRINPGDARFICRLLNDPSWIENIGERGVRTEDQAATYIREKMLVMYETHGFGLYVMETRDDGRAIGLCGLVRRESLPSPDLGFALLPEFRGRGFACEASRAIMAYARAVLHLPRLLAITTPGNVKSRQLLERLGFRCQRLAAESDEVWLYTGPEERPRILPRRGV